jgi:hypothetical protein
VAELLPEDTVKDDGTVADVLLLDSRTTTPAVGAFPVRLTVPVELTPPTTTEGLMLSACKLAGLTVIVAVCEICPKVAVTVADF